MYLVSQLNFVEAMLHSCLCGGFCCKLSRKRRGLTRALKADGTTGLPGNNITLRVRNGHDRVIERALDVGLSHSDVFALRTTNVCSASVFLLYHVLLLLPTSSCRPPDASYPYGYERWCGYADRGQEGPYDGEGHDSSQSPSDGQYFENTLNYIIP